MFDALWCVRDANESHEQSNWTHEVGEQFKYRYQELKHTEWTELNKKNNQIYVLSLFRSTNFLRSESRDTIDVQWMIMFGQMLFLIFASRCYSLDGPEKLSHVTKVPFKNIESEKLGQLLPVFSIPLISFFALFLPFAISCVCVRNELSSISFS